MKSFFIKHHKYNQNSRVIIPFHGFPALEKGSLLSGYSALIERHSLKVPGPDHLYMPDKLVDLLIRFLDHNNGRLSKRAKEKEFKKLTDHEIQAIEHKYAKIFESW